MSETEKDNPDAAGELELDPETVEDLDAGDDVDVKGGMVCIDTGTCNTKQVSCRRC